MTSLVKEWKEITDEMQERQIAELKAIWNTVSSNSDLFDKIIKNYSSPNRSYHGIIHLLHCVKRANENRSHFDHPNEAILALFMHDYIYDTHTSDFKNVKDSMDACYDLIALRPDAMGRLRSNILATSHAVELRTNDQKLVADIDLSMLVAYADEAIESMIRKEYAWVPLGQYTKARKDILKKLYLKDHIYHSDAFKHLEIKTKWQLWKMIKVNGLNILVAGTFDLLHKGHRVLLRDASELAGNDHHPKTITIGLTSDAMASKKSHPVQSYEIRKRQISNFVTRMNTNVDWKIVPLEDQLGDAATNPAYDVLVASKETLRGAELVNKTRTDNGLCPLILHVIEVINDEHGIRISSTNLRATQQE